MKEIFKLNKKCYNKTLQEAGYYSGNEIGIDKDNEVTHRIANYI